MFIRTSNIGFFFFSFTFFFFFFFFFFFSARNLLTPLKSPLPTAAGAGRSIRHDPNPRFYTTNRMSQPITRAHAQ
jgi:hypothetical protein